MRFLKLLVATIAMAMVASGVFAMPAAADDLGGSPPTHMDCSTGYSCTYYLSWEESQDLAYWGSLPAPLTGTQVNAAATALFMMAHRAFMLEYVNEGQCLAFQLSSAPWEPQGLMSHDCQYASGNGGGGGGGSGW